MMLTVVWNITNCCTWDCDFCVMASDRTQTAKELTMAEKMKVIEHLRGVDCRVDVSGGEVMLDRAAHLPLIAKLSEAVGKQRVGISCSGAYIGKAEARFLAGCVSEVEMTMDAHPARRFPRRPDGYHASAGRAADYLVAQGVRVGLQTVVTRDHLNHLFWLDELHQWLCTHAIAEWSLLRFFMSGRGAAFPSLLLNDTENLTIVRHAAALCRQSGSPVLDVHYLMAGSDKDKHCRCVKKSVGIRPDGTVTACFWGLDANGDIADGRYRLGNIVDTPLSELLHGDNALYWKHYDGGCPLAQTKQEGKGHVRIA